MLKETGRRLAGLMIAEGIADTSTDLFLDAWRMAGRVGCQQLHRESVAYYAVENLKNRQPA